MPRNGVAIGVLGHAGRALVDPRGLLSPRGLPWSVDWWVHAGDRWHLASRDVAVRQRLIGHAPIVETTMRVGGEDVTCVAYGAPGGVAVIEVANRTPVPIAVAFVVGPSDADAGAGPEAIAWDGARVVCVDGRPSVLFARAPAQAAGRRSGERELLELLELDAPPWRTVRGADHRAQAGFVFPLPRLTSVRALIALDGARLDPTSNPRSAPGPDDVARGWDRVVASSLAVDLPTARLGDAVEACRRRLLLAQDAGAPVSAVTTAARWGLIASVPSPVRARRRRRARPAAGAGPAIEHPSGGLDPRLTLEQAVIELAAGDAMALRRLRWALDVATGVWTWPTVIDPGLATGIDGDADDVLVTAAFLDVVRDLLISEGGHGLAVCTQWPEEWGRGGLEVHRVPTVAGLLSFAVRWHGDRPALLWELDGPATRLTAPGLDAEWSATAASGDALLAARPTV